MSSQPDTPADAGVDDEWAAAMAEQGVPPGAAPAPEPAPAPAPAPPRARFPQLDPEPGAVAGTDQLDLVMEGHLDPIIDALTTYYQAEKLKQQGVEGQAA